VAVRFLRAAGVGVAAGSDAQEAPVDPWLAMAPRSIEPLTPGSTLAVPSASIRPRPWVYISGGHTTRPDRPDISPSDSPIGSVSSTDRARRVRRSDHDTEVTPGDWAGRLRAQRW
jgi:hypothetical protein